VIVGAHDVLVRADTPPIRRFVVEFIEERRGSKATPLRLDELDARTAAIARAFPSPEGAPCGLAFDQYLAVEARARREKDGYVAVGSPQEARARKMYQAPMNVAAQTARFRLLREVVEGGRLHIPDTEMGRKLVNQLRGLNAWELSGGWKVEGREDDLADALVLALDLAQWLPPTGGDGAIELVSDGFGWDHESGVTARNVRWLLRHPDGRVSPAEWPPWDAGFPDYARSVLERGRSTRAIETWLLSRGLPTEPGAAIEALNAQEDDLVNVLVQHW
jgi:hypothetical protein